MLSDRQDHFEGSPPGTYGAQSNGTGHAHSSLLAWCVGVAFLVAT